jgi:hypothetical protein
MVEILELKTAYNSTFAIGGLQCSADSCVVAESSVLRMNICGEKPPIANLQNVIGNLKIQHHNNRQTDYND